MKNDANHVLVSTTTALHNAFKDHVIYIRLCMSLSINYAIVDDHVAVAIVFAKLIVFDKFT